MFMGKNIKPINRGRADLRLQIGAAAPLGRLLLGFIRLFESPPGKTAKQVWAFNASCVSYYALCGLTRYSGPRISNKSS